MSFVTFVAFILTFFVGYGTSHYTVSTWSVKSPVAIVVGVIVGILSAIFATLAVSPLVGL